MNNRRKKAGIFILLILVANFTFSIPVYASDDIEFAGNIVLAILPTTAFGIALHKNDHEGVIQFSKSLLTTLGVTAALKYSINAERPNGGSHSFPSGHTAVGFSGASFLQKRYGWECGIPVYIAASFIGWSRIGSDNHYFHDVLAGAVIGILSSYYFTKPYKGVTVTPIADKGIYGINISKNW